MTWTKRLRPYATPVILMRSGSYEPSQALPLRCDAVDIVFYIESFMKSVLVQLDESIFRALNRVAPAAARKRTEVVRAAVREAIRRAEEEKTRHAYSKHPDSEAEADDW